ncbi:amino acid transporter AVT1I [Brachypodium distachyon]|uniref:amino acid transporter AVT1I n=1 Tax=Brachypodium distachyon TaxID=15368 RepID=UPI000234DFCD|nr:amino acid transporter AVT1I [Brachypodium distachyon]|eukprot:XP_003566840.1 amino acid transporter AVT1I [Brachypodium distachyon]
MAAQERSPHEPLLLPPEKDDDMEAQLLIPRRDSAGTTCFSRSCLNLSNVISGIGMLSVPYALSQGGWLSLALFAAVGAVCYYTGGLIDRCMRADDSVRGYPDIGHLAFGPRGRRAIGGVMCVELYLVAISFLILEGDNLDKLFPGARLGLAAGYHVEGKELFVLVAAAVILPTTWLKDLSVLAYVSAVGLVSSAALTASLAWAAIAEAQKGSNLKGGGGSALLNLSGLPTSLSLFFVCFSGHGVFPTVYSSMKKKKDFPKVLLISSVLCSLNYALTAVLGYLLYGADVQPQVTLNLPTGKTYTKVAILTTLINPLAKYALVIQPIVEAIEAKLPLAKRGMTSRVLINTAIVVSTVVAASTLPFFGVIMSFIGSSLNVSVAVLFPCLSYLKIYSPGGGVRRFEFAVIIGVLVLGACVAVVGTYNSLHQIIASF